MVRADSAEVRIAGRARPAEVIGVALALAERDALEERDRRRLDREIGQQVVPEGERVDDGLEILRGWLARAPRPETAERIARVASALGLVRWLLAAIGLGLGWTTAAALLQVEVHAGRVNIVLCLGILVLVPLLLLIAAIGGALWSARASNDGTGGGWRGLALARGVQVLLPARVRDDVALLLGRLAAHDRLYARARRALLFFWSQWTGLAFALGALLATLGFVVFTDLAFGWSTTLDVEASWLHRLVSGLAAPWAALWPEAAPSLDLVETTRHFRVTARDPHVHFIDPLEYGAWWPFLTMSLIAYALLPRGLATGFGGRRLGIECGRAIAGTPGVERLLERLANPLVETRAPEAEGEIGRAAATTVPTDDAAAWLARASTGEVFVVAWAESIDDAGLLTAFGETPTLRVRDAGGRRSLAEDAERVAEIGASGAPVAVCVRAYEPPMLEFLDFMTDLRAACGPDRSLAVFLQGGEADHRETWQRKLASLGDPGLVTAAFALPTPAAAQDGAAP